MQPPDELMVALFLPAMRQLAAVRLRSQGLSQGRISALLGTTQASVSNYLNSDPSKAYSSLAALSVSKAVADAYSSELVDAVGRGPSEGVSAVGSIWRTLLGSGGACAAHREMYPSLETCDVCIRDYGTGTDAPRDAVSEVEDAVRLLESSPSFGSVIPEVSVNIACAPEGLTGPDDVIAVPGRIVRIRGRAKAFQAPEPGASFHLSRVLLAARKGRSGIRACMNLRYDRRMGKVLRRLGLKTLTIQKRPPAGGVDPTLRAISRCVDAHPGRFDAIVDAGGGGIEPNVYLFANGAREVAELALRVSLLYSAG